MYILEDVPTGEKTDHFTLKACFNEIIDFIKTGMNDRTKNILLEYNQLFTNSFVIYKDKKKIKNVTTIWKALNNNITVEIFVKSF